MRLTFIGATHEVTGSCYYLEACGRRFLVDCGMEQGPDDYQNVELPVAPGLLDFVLITHAHIDHTGKLPLLYKNGFRGKVYATDATCDLCDIMLRDSAHIQMFEAEWRNRKAKRAGKEEYIPLYDMQDVEQLLQNFVPCQYQEMVEPAPGIQIRFTDVGHLLGSASIELWMTEEDGGKKLVFSGDIGNLHQPLLKDPEYLDSADYVVMESTYGDRLHGQSPDYVAELTGVIQETFDRGGNLVIPSFAVGRTQEMLYFLRKIKADRLVKGHDGFSVYVDSPLAIEATHIFNENRLCCFDAEALELVKSGINPIAFEGLKVAVSSEDSKAINFDSQPKVIISASGMCDAGRIKHHLKHNLWRPESTILFVGYQANGSLGRAILEGAKTVKLFGEEIEVCAQIRKLQGVSGHADKDGLVKWLQAMSPKPRKVFVTHGDSAVCDLFTAYLKDQLQYRAEAPFSGACYDLLADAWLRVGTPVAAKKREGQKKQSDVFSRLVAMGKRLMSVIEKNQGGANKDLAKFADQITSLCDKWDK